MSLKWPVSPVKITQGFGEDPAYYAQFGQKGHNGLDIGVGTGTPLYAADDGTITFEGWGQNHSWAGKPAGIWILQNVGGSYVGYAHLQDTVISKGQAVKKGQLIGHTDSTGAATGPHLHFEMLPLAPNFQNGYAGRIDITPYISNPTIQGAEMNQAQAEELSLFLRLLQGNSIEDANKFVADDAKHMLADAGYAAALAKQIKYSDQWQKFAYKATHYDDLAAAMPQAGIGIDQETKDKINGTYDNTNWIKALLERIFR